MYMRPLGEDNETVWAVVYQEVEDTQPIFFPTCQSKLVETLILLRAIHEGQ